MAYNSTIFVLQREESRDQPRRRVITRCPAKFSEVFAISLILCLRKHPSIQGISKEKYILLSSRKKTTFQRFRSFYWATFGYLWHSSSISHAASYSSINSHLNALNCGLYWSADHVNACARGYLAISSFWFVRRSRTQKLLSRRLLC